MGLLFPLADRQHAQSAPTGLQSPSENIACRYFGYDRQTMLRCDITDTTVTARRPADCDLEWGKAFEMNARGNAVRLCHGDTAMDRSLPVLGYGKVWQRGGFTCASERTRMTCFNADRCGFRRRGRGRRCLSWRKTDPLIAHEAATNRSVLTLPFATYWRAASISAGGKGNMADAIRDILNKLHDCCTNTLNRSLADDFNAMNGASYSFSSDLDNWNAVLEGRPEQTLYATAANEFALALLNNSQGQYRNAFKGLRLSLELVLQGVYLSANLIVLNEWLTSQADTSWSAIIDQEKGIFSRRFCRAFFPEVTEDAGTFGILSATLYREMSECTHGNVPNKIPLPKTIEFDKSTFEMWHSKAGTLRYITNFVLTVRYYSSLPVQRRQRIAPTILDQIGSINQIRTVLEATT